MKYKLKNKVSPFRFWAGRAADPEIYFIKKEGEIPDEIFDRIPKKVITEVKENNNGS